MRRDTFPDPDQPPDEELIRRVLTGDRDLFRELVIRHKNIVFSSLMRMTGSRQLAEELTQETFVRAYTGLSTFRHEARFSTWLVQISSHCASTYFTSRSHRERLRSVEFDHEFHSPAGPSAEHELALRRRLELFWRAMQKLSARHREVLLLCGLEGNSYEEVASLLGIPVGTVRSRLNTARRLMRELVTAEERRR